MTSKALTVIQQGDQYAIGIIVRCGDAEITPQTCEDMKIKLGSRTKTYLSGGLSFQDGVWLFPLTQEQSLSVVNGMTTIQAQYRMGSEIQTTPVYPVQVDLSIIREVWE